MTRTTIVHVPDILEPRAMGEDFVELVEHLNEAAVAGQEYLLAMRNDGTRIALPVHGLVIEEEED